MLLKEYLEKLNDIVEKNPEALNYVVIYSSDDEGNSFDTVNYTPSMMKFDEDNREALSYCDDDYEFNSICVN